MFTGIITDLGRVRALEQRGDLRLEIGTAFDLSQVALGASIACNGCCLTVVDKGADWFVADVSAETLDKTTLGSWRLEQRINLEGSLKLGAELGGHLVYGHVDGLAEITEIRPEGGSLRFRFAPPAGLSRFIAAKGSVTLDGVSLTVNDVADDTFGVNIVPHTCEVTTFGHYVVGDKVNLEIDMLARYVARLLEQSA
jgi:riboflavin synthase|tara:strand:+ start:1997 stop:2587 length:591 start_codon:yes stop_codon:yes gene_type:complete